MCLQKAPLIRKFVVQVKKADDSVGPAVEEAVKGMSNGEVIALLPHSAEFACAVNPAAVSAPYEQVVPRNAGVAHAMLSSRDLQSNAC